MLDTNICIYLLNGNKELEKKVKKIGVFSLSISNATLAELYFGAYNSHNVDSNIKRIEAFKMNLIASIAYSNNCILVTNNPDHFERIDELKIENWIKNQD